MYTTSADTITISINHSVSVRFSSFFMVFFSFTCGFWL